MTFQYTTAAKEDTTCPLCGGDSFERLASVDRYNMGLSTVACRQCGMITTNPILSSSEVDDFYKHHYRRVYNKIARPSERYIIDNEIDRRARYTAEFLMRMADQPDGARILDVGCSEGSLLKELSARRPTWHPFGVEPGEFGEFAKTYVGCTVAPTLDEVPPEPFHLVIVNHVLEHVSDPAAFLRILRDRLAPNGTLYVDVPDASAYATISDLHVAHLHHFTTSTLRRLAARAGLKTNLIESHRPPRHPPSVRALLVAGETTETLAESDQPDAEAARRIRLIGSGALWPRVRGSRAVSAGIELGRRISKAIRVER